MSKSKKSDKFLKLVGEHKERKKVEKFHGTLEDYLRVIEKDTSITQLAHRRLYDALSSHGITKMNTSEERCNKLFGSEQLRTYDYFQGKFFGSLSAHTLISLPLTTKLSPLTSTVPSNLP